jgi:hypothetical protein
MPHAPQWAASLRVSTSQPSSATPLQSAKPIWQAKPHSLPMQVACALATLQTRPQAPQWATSVLRSRHTPPQQVWPPGQAPPSPHLQLPPTHRLAVWLSQAVPHAPQWFTSALRFRQVPLQQSGTLPVARQKSAPQCTPQMPSWQVWPWAHPWPHAPQWFGFVCWSTQVSAQTSCPVGQSQLPFWHARPPVQVVQAMPPAPHCAALAPGRQVVPSQQPVHRSPLQVHVPP